MFHPQNKPENALKTAEEFEKVQSYDEALKTLNDLLSNRHRHTEWTRTHEEAMTKYIDLCVKQREGRMAKDGLIQYRQLCQTSNIESLDTVIRHYLKEARAKAEEAQEKSAATEEEEDSPEMLLLKSVSGEESKQRSERALVTPWVVFLWEAYRNVLETLKLNAKLEKTYQETARQAFDYCLKYNRRNEFKKLAELLRQHLQTLYKVQAQPDAKTGQENKVNVNAPETIKMLLETRFKQLEIASKLELWQEALRAMGDIRSFMRKSRRAFTPEMMSQYYESLTKLFWVSKYYNFHAHSWLKILYHTRPIKGASEEEIRRVCNHAMLAALSIPLLKEEEDAQMLSTDHRTDYQLSTLLGTTKFPKRSVMLRDLMSRNTLDNCSQPVKDLYTVLETGCNPLHICQNGCDVLVALEKDEDLAEYKDCVEENLIRQTILQLLDMYEELSIEKLQKIVSPIPFMKVERVIMDSFLDDSHQRIVFNHQNGTVRFGARDLNSLSMKSQLVNLKKKLVKVERLLHPQIEEEQKSELARKFSYAREFAEDERIAYLERKNIIEKRKEAIENERREKERKEKEAEDEKERKKREVEQKRLEEEAKRREEERKKKEEKELELLRAKALVAQLEKEGKKPAIDVQSMDVNDEEDTSIIEKVIQTQAEKDEKVKREQESKLRGLAKKLDYLERARREAERPLLHEDFEKKLEEDRRHHEEQTELDRENWEKKKQNHAAEKERLSRMKSDKEHYVQLLMARRREAFEKDKQEQEERKEQRRREWLQEREEMKQKREEERRRKEAEEEEMWRKQEEERKRLEKLEETLRKQLEKEREIEEKLKQKEERKYRPIRREDSVKSSEGEERKEEAEKPEPEKQEPERKAGAWRGGRWSRGRGGR